MSSIKKLSSFFNWPINLIRYWEVKKLPIKYTEFFQPAVSRFFNFKMRIFVFLFLVKIASSQIFKIPNYEGAVDAMESEKNQEILKEIFPDYKKSGGRSGRIINGEIAELGEFPYQTLQYMTENGNNWWFFNVFLEFEFKFLIFLTNF